MNDKTHDSKLIHRNQQADKLDGIWDFDPRTSTEDYSYTPARVMKPVYNIYKAQRKPQVVGFYSDSSQYDVRIDATLATKDGPGYDLSTVPPTAYDKIIFGFAGVVGDYDEKAVEIAKAAVQLNKSLHEPTFTDPFGDFQSERNCGLLKYKSAVDFVSVTQENCNGVLGGLRDLQARAKDAGHKLVLSLGIGGPQMSKAFHSIAKHPESRHIFALGVVKLLKQFPMFSEIDLNWQFPDERENKNPFGRKVSFDYNALIAELDAQSRSAGLSRFKINIAAPANISQLKQFFSKSLPKSNVCGINLMTFDYFTTSQKNALYHTHHMTTGSGEDSIESVISYLTNLGVASDNIYIGYAGYSRNAKNANISAISPLTGTFKAADKVTTGTRESGVSVWADITYHYLDLENQCGRNGFSLYTDQAADADYLYNPTSKLFMSLDTPRTVKAKGEYAAKHNLGGVFAWEADQDNGLLINAAREGLGYEIDQQMIDMQPFYFKGITGSTPKKEFPAWEDGHAYKIGDKITYSGTHYQCINAHVAIPTWAPGLAATLWSRVVL